MRALKDRVGVRLALIVAVGVGILIGAALVGIGAMANTSVAKKAPVAHTACRHFGENAKNPCWIGNVLAYCGYGKCEYSKYMTCKLSAELGQKVAVEDNPEKGYIIKHPHRLVMCRGSATILKVYREKGSHVPYVYQEVQVHSAHTVNITLYGHYEGNSILTTGEGLVVMADRPARASAATYARAGSSCAHPVKSVLATDFERRGTPYGVQKHMPISYEYNGGAPTSYYIGPVPTTKFDSTGGRTESYTSVSFSSDKSIIICRATLKTMNLDTGEARHYSLTTTRHRGEEFTVGTNRLINGAFEVVVEGRYADPAKTATQASRAPL